MNSITRILVGIFMFGGMMIMSQPAMASGSGFYFGDYGYGYNYNNNYDYNNSYNYGYGYGHNYHQQNNSAPVWASIAHQRGRVGDHLSFAVYANDPDGDIVRYSALNVPYGASFNGSSRTFSWTPTQAGTYVATFRAYDDCGDCYSDLEVTIIIEARPVLTPPPVYNPPVYNPPIYPTPTYNPPVYPAPTYNPPVYQAPVYNPPVYQTPTYNPPVYQTPTYNPPVYQTPTYNPPVVYQRPTYQIPTYQSPIVINPIIQRPIYQPPIIHAPINYDSAIEFIGFNPLTKAREGELYTYTIQAFSAGNEMSYRLIESPQGMTINEKLGVILWVPNFSQGGRNPYVVTVAAHNGYHERMVTYYVVVEDVKFTIKTVIDAVTTRVTTVNTTENTVKKEEVKKEEKTCPCDEDDDTDVTVDNKNNRHWAFAGGMGYGAGIGLLPLVLILIIFFLIMWIFFNRKRDREDAQLARMEASYRRAQSERSAQVMNQDRNYAPREEYVERPTGRIIRDHGNNESLPDLPRP